VRFLAIVGAAVIVFSLLLISKTLISQWLPNPPCTLPKGIIL